MISPAPSGVKAHVNPSACSRGCQVARHPSLSPRFSVSASAHAPLGALRGFARAPCLSNPPFPLFPPVNQPYLLNLSRSVAFPIRLVFLILPISRAENSHICPQLVLWPLFQPSPPLHITQSSVRLNNPCQYPILHRFRPQIMWLDVGKR
jgi:hypothetical protein